MFCDTGRRKEAVLPVVPNFIHGQAKLFADAIKQNPQIPVKQLKFLEFQFLSSLASTKRVPVVVSIPDRIVKQNSLSDSPHTQRS